MSIDRFLSCFCLVSALSLPIPRLAFSNALTFPPPPPPSRCPSARLPVYLFYRRCCPLLPLLRIDEQGGEFAFVAFGMAERLGILEPQLCKLLLTTVAISMAATPALSTFSAWVADQVRQSRASGSPRDNSVTDADTRPRRRHRRLHLD